MQHVLADVKGAATFARLAYLDRKGLIELAPQLRRGTHQVAQRICCGPVVPVPRPTEAAEEQGAQDPAPSTRGKGRAAATIFATRKQDDVVVAVRGTMIPESLLDAADVVPAPHALSGGERGATALVHRGFRSQYRLLQPGVLRALRPLGPALRTLRFVGHSSGGACAALLAEAFAAEAHAMGWPVDTQCVSLGCPRFATVELHDALRARGVTWQGVNLVEDVVPLLPLHAGFVEPTDLLLVTQQGDEAWLRARRQAQFGRKHACGGEEEWLAQLRHHRTLGSLLDAHSCTRYVQAISVASRQLGQA